MITLKNIKEEIFCKKVLNLPYKTSSLIAGLIAMGLIFTGSINILINPALSISQIFYGFFIMLPLSYYHKLQSEKYGE